MSYELVLDNRDHLTCRLALLMPCYNADRFILPVIANLEKIRSKLSFDIIVIDDGSVRPVVEVLGSNLAGTVVLRSEENLGIVEGLNAGLSFCINSGYEFVARQDADDFSTPNRFCAQIETLEKTQRIVCGSGFFIMDYHGNVVATRYAPGTDRETSRALYFRNPFAHSSLMFYMKYISELGLYDKEFEGAEDYEIIWRAARHGGLCSIRSPLVYYRSHIGSISGNRFPQALQDLRVSIHHCDWSMLSMLGLIKKLALLCVPRSLLFSIQTRFYRNGV